MSFRFFHTAFPVLRSFLYISFSQSRMLFSYLLGWLMPTLLWAYLDASSFGSPPRPSVPACSTLPLGFLNSLYIPHHTIHPALMILMSNSPTRVLAACGQRRSPCWPSVIPRTWHRAPCLFVECINVQGAHCSSHSAEVKRWRKVRAIPSHGQFMA